LIRITVEVWPGGFADGKRTIGAMNIANVSDLAAVSDYKADIWEAGNPMTRRDERQCSVHVRGHVRSLGVWTLIAKVLKQATCEGYGDAGDDG